MKECKTCHKALSISEFYVNIGSPGGFGIHCKRCCIKKDFIYSQTPSGVASKARANRKYIKSDKGSITKNRYPTRTKARAAVNREVRWGRLPKPNNCPCTNCGEQATQYHHWRGYANRFWLDVIPMCTFCH